jgi:hypothetical protein
MTGLDAQPIFSSGSRGSVPHYVSLGYRHWDIGYFELNGSSRNVKHGRNVKAWYRLLFIS